jgi:isoleucyl-tRNA synthetase
MELRQLAAWEAMGVYQRILEARPDAPPYVLHDGPPYPTGEIHLGTALNKILKDMVVKSKTMAGFRAPYVPGWDCHGLPIETQVEKQLGGRKTETPPAEFRRMCRDFASRYVEIHRREFKRLGVFGQWEDPYLSMSPEYEACIADVFVTVLEKGYVYRGLKPVYWCIHDGTALAEAEVEYEDHTSPSIWVKFPLASDAGADKPAAAPRPANKNGGLGAVSGSRTAGRLGENVAAVVWTTTPWTVPHNRALAFHPDFDYVVAETRHGPLLLAEERARSPEVAQALGIAPVKSRPVGKGRELEGMKFRHPLLDLRVPAVLAEYVTLEQGSGIVHTAPGHGAEDFLTGQKYGLETYAPMDDSGRYLEGLPEYRGKTVFEANPAIIELLRERGALLAEGKLRHSYPHCWRCHQPVIFRATEQWFINLEHNGLRQRALEEIARVRWTPEWGAERMQAMVSLRPDWCISRQRLWGVPLVIFYCEQCRQRLEDIAALRHVVRWFEREGVDAWYSRSPEELLPPGRRCPCGASRWRKETDILDVWFDSGSSHFAVLRPRGEWPADLYLEGPDQFRGWFHSSLLLAVGVEGRAPYRQVLTYGWALDEKGRPMSKSLGNVILPRDICEKWGADLLRVWVASQDYHSDMRMSERGMVQLAEAYRKLRNTFRFALSNLADFDPGRHSLAADELWEMDRWMLERAADLVAQCRGWYENFEFHRVFHAAHNFAVVDLSAFYFDVLKDRLYTYAPRNPGRRSAQTVLERIAGALVRLLAPILVFTSEEVWKHLPRRPGDPESVHMAVFPAEEELRTGLDPARRKNWESLLGVRESVLKALEEARVSKEISGSLEAKVILFPGTSHAALLEEYREWLPAIFIVSQVEIRQLPPGEPSDGWQVVVERAGGGKCERCWNYSVHVGRSATYPTLCERCVAAVEEMEGGGGS